MKRLFSMLIATCMLVIMTTSVYALGYGEELQNSPTKTPEQKFSDVTESHWAFRYISEMADRGVLNGYPDGKFYPDYQVTRAEFAKIMTTAAGLPVTNPTLQIFSDVQITDWYASYVHTAKDYLSAYTRNDSIYYLPTTPALREDIAVALVKLKGYSTADADLTILEKMFSDYQSISEGAKAYVATAIENGLVTGYSDGTFKGQNGVTRAEAATLVWRAYQYENKNVIDVENTQSQGNIANNQVQKPYTMKILTKVELENPYTSTVDNENLYYVYGGRVYRTNVHTGNSEIFFDTTSIPELDIDADGKEYKYDSDGLHCTLDSYVPFQVFYDAKYDRLLLSGYYEKMHESLETTNGKFCVVYDITNGNPAVIGYVDWDSWNGMPKVIHEVISEYEFLMSDEVKTTGLVSTASCHIVNFKNRSVGEVRLGATAASYLGIIRYQNSLYSLKSDMGKMYVKKADLSADTYDTVAKGTVDFYAIKDGNFYLVDYFGDEINKFNTKDEAFSNTTIDFSKDIYSEEPITSTGFDMKFYVIDDNTMIFYDYYIDAFRILTHSVI